MHLLVAEQTQWSIISNPLLRFRSEIVRKSIIYGIKSEPINVLCIRWIWQEGRDERVFYLFPDTQEIYLTCEDIQFLPAFQALFSFDKKEPRLVKLSHVLANALRSHSLKYDNNRDYLLEASSRGSFSFAFGHYIRDMIPYLVFFNNSISKLFSFKPARRGETEVLDLISRQYLQDTHIGYDSIQATSQLAIKLLPHIRVYALRASFVYLSLGARLRILNDLSPSTRRSQQNKYISNVLVLSRQQDYSTPANSNRWANENEFVGYSRSSLLIHVVSPEKTGVTRLHSIIASHAYDVVVSVFGSALYQIFMYPECYAETLILMGDLNDDEIWQSVLFDFYPFRHKFWLLYTPANRTAPINQLFKIPPSAIVTALHCMHSCSNTQLSIDIEGGFRLRPPQF